MVASMSSNQRWRVYIKNLETHTRVGIHAHEQIPQRIIVNATIEADYALRPDSIDDCFNYDHLRHWVVTDWPKRPQTALLETLIIELLEHIFHADHRIAYARVSICKPDIFPEAMSVGVETEWTRADFERLATKP